MKWPRVVFFLNILVTKCWTMTQSELEEFSDFLQKTSQLDLNLKSNTDVEGDEDDVIQDNAWEESGKFEGDLILNDRQRRVIVESVAEGLSRNGLRDTTKRWPDNEVVYFIQREHFNDDQLHAIKSGIEDIAQASCVKFRPYQKGDRDAVVIQGSRRGCFSQVGYQGGYQVLNLYGRHPVGRGCFRHGTVVHELLHTLGFYHMQSSPDRDDYIDVHWENILQPARHNFRKYNTFAVSDFGIGYDYESVLHYGRKAFSSNGQDTLVPKQNGANIGQRLGLSDKDTQKLNKMYCDADSNSDDESQVPLRKPNKKENSKNKPFEGHGIGYHQGKTVVIKLPAAETYRVPDIPTFHLFDYFSKAPQVLSQTPTEKNGFRGGVVPLQHKLIPSLPAEERRPILPNAELPDQYRIIEMRPENFPGDGNIAPLIPKENFKQYQSNIKQYINNIMFANEEEKGELDQKSIKLEAVNQAGEGHDYPIEVSDIYRIKNDYSGFYTPRQNYNTGFEGLDVQGKDKIVKYNTNTNMKKQGNENKSDIVSHSRNLPIYENKDFSKHDNDGDDFEEEIDVSFKTSNPIHKQNVQHFSPMLNNKHFYQINDYKDYEASSKNQSGGDWINNYEYKRHKDADNLNKENKKDFRQLEMNSPKNNMRLQYEIVDNNDWADRY
ncbi:uncharacterized protein LOC106720435 isoform X1 [Papilio machaon]|uniref:uncharacterized protein LOC106720435 isoform X1 n=1 Tax=Papilio machaon TaxID=76193 RepID=UPI001E6661D5|nr:uncharacterized protein LOC106720435 isoform X1 [Papilio machaon]